jgi:hypothetical protein
MKTRLLLAAAVLQLSLQLARAGSTDGTDLFNVGNYITTTWRSSDFKGTSSREWSPSGDSFKFVWDTKAGDQIGRIGVTYGSSYLGPKIDDMNDSCVMSTNGTFTPSSSAWFDFSIYGWTNPTYTYWSNTPGGKGWNTEFYIVCYTDETPAAFLADKNLKPIGSVVVDGQTYDCYHTPRDFQAQWWAVRRPGSWTPSVNLKKIFEYWRSKGLANEAIVDIGWAVEGFSGTGGKLQLTDIQIPHLGPDASAPATH